MFKKYILRAVPYKGGSTRSESSAGAAVYKLSSNENMLGPSPMAIRAIERALPRLFEYDHQDDMLLREAITESMDNAIQLDQVITANSGMELLDIICRAFIDQSKECIISTPTFLAYKNFIELSGGTVRHVPLNPGNFSLNVKGILNAINDNTRIIFISSPNNPTGAIVKNAELTELVERLPEKCVVMYDEVYHHYVNDRDFARAINYVNAGYPVIGLHSFSKAYGLAGIRLGYAFSTPPITTYLRNIRRPFMINTLAIEAGIAALSDTDHIKKTVDLVAEEKKFLYDALCELGIRHWTSEANFILIEAPYNATKLAADLLRGNVMVRTGEVFGAPGTIRLTIGTRDANTAFVNNIKLLI